MGELYDCWFVVVEVELVEFVVDCCDCWFG